MCVTMATIVYRYSNHHPYDYNYNNNYYFFWYNNNNIIIHDKEIVNVEYTNYRQYYNMVGLIR